MHIGRTIALCASVALGPTLLGAGDPALVLDLVAERPQRGLNPFVLTTLVSPRLIVEIDWVEGYRPTERALHAAQDVLRKHCDSDKHIEVILDDEIPETDWLEATQRSGLEQLVARHLDGDPSDWTQAEIVYVLYAPDSRSWYEDSPSGMTDRVVFLRGETIATVRTVFLFTDEIRRDAILWVTASKVERSTLVHELGHVIGLVDNADHAQPEQPGHCSVKRCVMHQPGKPSGIVNGLPAFFTGRIPSRYRERCAEDIAAAGRLWRERERAFPGLADELRSARLLREKAAAEGWRTRQGLE